VFDWLFEGRLPVYLFLGVVALVFAALYVRTRKRFWFYPIGGIVVLVAVYFLLDRLNETRSEQIVRKLREMAAAVQRQDADTIFRHVSENFNAGGHNRSSFRHYVELAFQRGVNRLTVWEFQFPDDTGRVTFFAKPDGSLPGLNTHYLVRATFVLEGSEWRLQTFQVFNPFANSTTPLDMPGLR
jgi:hypothetical protein